MIKSEAVGVVERWHGFCVIPPSLNETPVDLEKCRSEEILTSDNPRHYSHNLQATVKELGFTIK